MRPVSPIFLGLLAACGQAPREETAKAADPAIADAINDPIMVDSQLSVQAGGGPALIAVPPDAVARVASDLPTLGQVAARAAAMPVYRGCNAKIDYAMTWLARLPADLPMPKDGVAAEAAGSDTRACALRLVRYAVAAPADAVAGHYRALARQGGYSISMDGGNLQARRKDSAAFSVAISPTNSGSSVDFLTNRGR